MKRSVTMLVLSILLAPVALRADSSLEVPSPPVAMGSLAYLDARNGFRDMQFGTPFSTFKNLHLEEDSGDIKVYSRPGDALTMGEAKLAHLYYAFYKGRLSNVHMTTDGPTSSRAALASLQAAYGTPRKPNQFLEEYWWIGRVVVASYTENLATRTATIICTSRPLTVQKEADQKESAKKAAAGL